MATALASLLTDRPVRPKLGMTGEITLRGKVLPIGGVKEKVLAAARYGLDTVILPRRNESDLDEVPEAVRNQMKFIFVDTVDQVLVAALLSPEEVQRHVRTASSALTNAVSAPTQAQDIRWRATIRCSRACHRSRTRIDVRRIVPGEAIRRAQSCSNACSDSASRSD